MTVQPCSERFFAPCTAGGRGLQGLPLAGPPPLPASEVQTAPRGRLAPPPPPGHAPRRSALKAAGWGRRGGEVRAQLWLRVRQALSRQNRPCPGCSHGKPVRVGWGGVGAGDARTAYRSRAARGDLRRCSPGCARREALSPAAGTGRHCSFTAP